MAVRNAQGRQMSLGRDVLMFTFGLCAGIILLSTFVAWFMHRLKGSLESALGTQDFQDAMTGALAETRADELLQELAISKDAAEKPTDEPASTAAGAAEAE